MKSRATLKRLQRKEKEQGRAWRENRHPGVHHCAPQNYVASYESRALVAAKVAELPEDEREDGWADIAHGGDCDTRQAFGDLEAAVKWLQTQINAEQTVFGQGDVDLIVRPLHADRCQFCTCSGYRRLRSWIVDDQGIAEERDGAEHACCN